MMKRIRTLQGQPLFIEETDFIDEVTGNKRTLVEFVKRKPDGTRVRIPITIYPRVTNYTKGTILFGGDETCRLKQHEIDRLYGEYKKVIMHA